MSRPSDTKSLLIINSRFLPIIGGGETYVLELMQYFSSLGWNVSLVTNNISAEKIHEWNGCSIYYIDGFDDTTQSISDCAPALRKVLDIVKPTLVHVHNIMPFFAYSCITEPKEFPTVLTIHNTPNIPERIFGSFNDYDSERIFTRQLLKNQHYQRLLLGSEYYLTSYATVAPWILTEGKAEVIHYFPPQITQGTSAQDASDSNKTTVQILYPSRLMKRKGIEEALRALAVLPKHFHLSVPAFHSAEDKNYQTMIREMIESLGLQDRVIIPADVTPPSDMPAFYKNADIVLIPSHYEGFGIVAVEAMSWRLPVIATAVGGLAEIVQDEYNGLLIAPGNHTAIKHAVLRIFGDKILRDSLIAGGIETATNKFSRMKHLRRVELIYDEVSR